METPLAVFLDSFLSLRKQQHIRLVLVKKLQERTELKSAEKLGEIHPQYFAVGFHQQIHNPCLPVCNLTTAVVMPSCCHSIASLPVLPPPFMLPYGTHIHTAQCPQHSSLCFDHDDFPCPGKFPKWPTRPARLQPLKVEHRRHQQAPQ